MNLFSKKETISVKDHLYHSIKPIFSFDPIPDFIRTSEPDLLTKTELQRLTYEDYQLLTAIEFEKLINHWASGKIGNLSKNLELSEAYDKLSYWLGFCLPFIFKDIGGASTAEAKTEKALEGIQVYLDEIADSSKKSRQDIFDTLGMVYAYRVLGKLPPEELDGKRYYYVKSFGTNLCIYSDREISSVLNKLNIVYTAPEN